MKYRRMLCKEIFLLKGWKGDITKNPGFWSKADYTAQCCSIKASTQAYLATGATLKTSSNSG